MTETAYTKGAVSGRKLSIRVSLHVHPNQTFKSDRRRDWPSIPHRHWVNTTCQQAAIWQLVLACSLSTQLQSAARASRQARIETYGDKTEALADALFNRAGIGGNRAWDVMHKTRRKHPLNGFFNCRF